MQENKQNQIPESPWVRRGFVARIPAPTFMPINPIIFKHQKEAEKLIEIYSIGSDLESPREERE